MVRRSISAIFVGLLLIGIVSPVHGATTRRGDTIEKIKADVAKGTAEKVVVTMKGGSKLKGVVSNVLPDSFDLVDTNTRQPTTIPYRDVEKVKKQGWSTGAKVALGAAIGAAVVVAVVFGALANDPFLGPVCPLGC
jgi:hypothetical protein